MVAGSSPAGPIKNMDSLNSQKKIIIELKELLVSHRLFANKLSIEQEHFESEWEFHKYHEQRAAHFDCDDGGN